MKQIVLTLNTSYQLLSYDTEVLLLLARKILSVKRHLAVTNVSNHWYLFTQWSMIKDLMTF